jgi:hypothetical protein
MPDSIAETKKKLLEINKVIAELDPAIRAAAYDRLAPLYFEGAQPPAADGKMPAATRHVSQPRDESDDKADFIAKFDHEKPSDNVLLITAWLFKEYGDVLFSTGEISKLAQDFGLTIPDSPYMTLVQAQKKGKTLFARSGKNWKFTVHAERYLKETYQVRKGTKPRPAANGD